MRRESAVYGSRQEIRAASSASNAPVNEADSFLLLFSSSRNVRRLISYWTIKNATGGGVSGRKRGETVKGAGDRVEDEKRE